MKRTPDDFEIIVLNGNHFIGRGKYGEVRLVRDKKD